MLVKFKKYLVFIVLIFILLGIIVLKMAVKPQAPQPIPPSVTMEIPPAPEAPPNLDYSFAVEFPDLPRQVPVYTITNPPAVSLDEARVLAAGFGLSGEPIVSQDIKEGDFYSWTAEDRYLSVGGKPPVISFGRTLFNISTQSAVLSPKIAAQVGEKILKEKGLAKPNLDLSNPKFSYFKIKRQSLEETKDSQEAQVIKVSFDYQINSLPLLPGSPAASPVSLFLGPNEELVRLIYTKYPQELTKTQEATLLSSQQALENLKAQKGTIVHLLSEEDINSEVPPVYQISRATINRVFLAYYYPPTPETQVLPIFVFEAKAVDQKTGKTVKTIVYLPATLEP